MKKYALPLVIFVIVLVVLGGYLYFKSRPQKVVPTEQPQTTKEVVDEPEAATSDRLTYKNDKFKFELKLPKTWEGYQVFEGDYPSYSVVSFSFKGTHQPFALIQIVRRTQEQWSNVNQALFNKVLENTAQGVVVCEGCCSADENFTGGGQFDEFQIARCKEGAEIIKTYKPIH